MPSTKYEIEKFTGVNDFGLWRLKMKALLVQQGCLEALKGTAAMDAALTEKEKTAMIEKAHSAILLSLGDKVLRQVSKETTASGLWVKLESLYMTKSLVNRLYLKQALYSFKMSEDKVLAEQLDMFNKLILDLENIDVKIEDEDQALLLLCALPRTHAHFKETLLYGRESLTFEEVQSALYSKDLNERKEHKPSTVGEGLAVKGKFLRKDGKFDKKKGKSQQKSYSGEASGIRCYHCKKEGHTRKVCPERLKDHGGKDNGNAAIVQDDFDSSDVLVVSSSDSRKEWIMDSGCTWHMTPNKDLFEELCDQDGGSVLLGNNKACKIAGVGSVRFKLHDESIRLLTEVRYVPDLKRNLISLGEFDKKGYVFQGEKSILRVMKGSKEVLRGVKKQGLYTLEAEVVSGSTNVASTKPLSKTEIWHMRLGHVSERGLVELGKQNLLGGDKVEKLKFCEPCVLGKSCRVKFNKGKQRTHGSLDYIHADLWGPARCPSHSGARYFLSIVDDYSRKLWVFIQKTKDETFENFKSWKTLVENQTGRKVKRLRTDNGLEFCNEAFDSFCAASGIARHRTTAGTPQQNGLAERFNRTILERVRCMLTSAGLKKVFWAEAVSTATYLINRCPSTALDMKTPEEVWSGHPPDLDKLRVFGCVAYAHIRQDKVEPRALKCMFMGYPEGVKAYRLWCLEPGHKRCITSRDVVFNEAEMAFKKTDDVGRSAEISDEELEQGEIPVEVEHVDAELHIPDEVEEDTEEVEETVDDYLLARDRQRRVIKPPQRLGYADLIAYALISASEVLDEEPRDYKEVMRSRNKTEWLKAMDDEMKSLHDNNTWELIKKPAGARLVSCKWIFKVKEGIEGVASKRYKARLVARGFTQKEGVDFNDVFSPVVKHRSIRMLLAMVAQFDLELEQMDVKTAFLYGDLDETILMRQPEGYVEKGKEDYVCKLKRSLYGLKQSPRQWNRRFDKFMARISFIRSQFDHCVYFRFQPGNSFVILLLYVDDILIASNNVEDVMRVKAELNKEFDMKDLGAASRILGIDIRRDRKQSKLCLSQEAYLRKILDKFGMSNSKPVVTPTNPQFKLSIDQCPSTDVERAYMNSIPYANIVGSLMYAMVCTRPDIAYAVSLVSRYMANPGKAHWQALKWILRYINGSLNRVLIYGGALGEDSKAVIEGYVDSDYAGCMDSRKSISGYVFTMFGTTISWKATLQKVVALSTTEAEYIALTEAVKEALWLEGFAKELKLQGRVITVKCDSQSAIHLSKNSAYHERTKHIDVRLHFVRGVIERGEVQVLKVSTDHNAADMITKTLPSCKFFHCMQLVKLHEES